MLVFKLQGISAVNLPNLALTLSYLFVLQYNVLFHLFQVSISFHTISSVHRLLGQSQFEQLRLQ